MPMSSYCPAKSTSTRRDACAFVNVSSTSNASGVSDSASRTLPKSEMVAL